MIIHSSSAMSGSGAGSIQRSVFVCVKGKMCFLLLSFSSCTTLYRENNWPMAHRILTSGSSTTQRLAQGANITGRCLLGTIRMTWLLKMFTAINCRALVTSGCVLEPPPELTTKNSRFVFRGNSLSWKERRGKGPFPRLRRVVMRFYLQAISQWYNVYYSPM